MHHSNSDKMVQLDKPNLLSIWILKMQKILGKGGGGWGATNFSYGYLETLSGPSQAPT